MKKLINIKMKVNGVDTEVAVEPWRSLTEILRYELGLTGTKIGCNDGNCGACTVLMDGQPVRSCLVLAAHADGREITTIEGLAQNGALHPIQEAFIEHFAVQCGYCTPGMIMQSKALLDENPVPTETEVREALHGNLCRCTGYVKIVEAVLAAGEKMAAATKRSGGRKK